MQRLSRSIRHTRCCAVLALLAIIAGVFSRTAHAQGLHQVIAEPISTGQLINMLEQFTASEGQQRAILDMHDAYKLAYRELCEGPVEAYSDVYTKFSGNMMNMAPPDFVRSVFDSASRARRGLDDIENELYDKIETVLTDEQRVSLSRVRSRRHRDRLRTPVPMSSEIPRRNHDSPNELGDVLRSLDLAPSVTAAVDPLLESYERRLTSVLQANKRLAEQHAIAERELQLARARQIAELLNLDSSIISSPQGLIEYHSARHRARTEDPEIAQRIAEIGRPVTNQLHQNRQARAQAVANVRIAAVRQIAAALPEQHRREWLLAYYTQQHRVLGSVGDLSYYKQVDFDAIDGLSDDERDALATGVLAPWAQLEDEIVAAGRRLDETGPMPTNRSAANQHIVDEHDAVRRKLADLRSTVFSQATKLIRERLNSDQQAQLGTAANERSRTRNTPTQPKHYDNRSAGATRMHTLGQGRWLDPFIAIALDADEIEIITNILGVSAEHADAISAAHADYRGQFPQHVDALWGDLNEAREAMWTRRDETGGKRALTSLAAFDAFANARRRLIDAIHQADDALFDALRTLLDGVVEDGWIDLARDVRRRIVNSPNNMPGLDRTKRGRIDLVVLVFSEPRDANVRQAVFEILKQYAAQAATLNEARLDACFVHERGFTSSRWLRPDPDQIGFEESQRITLKLHAGWIDAHRGLVEIETDIAELNDAFLERLRSVLGEDQSRELKQEYLRWAYPQVYVDQRAPFGALARARALPSLTTSQRDALITLTGDVRYEYDEVSEKLTQLERATGEAAQAFKTGDTDAMNVDRRANEMQRVDRKRTLLQFERSEINSRTVWMMELLLSDQQIAACAPPPILDRIQ